VAGAQPAGAEDPKTEALKLFEQSAGLYREGKFAEAADLLERAYGMHKEPVLLYNLARAYDGLGENQKAVDAYKRYLEQVPDAKDRGAIERRVDTLEKQLEREKALKDEQDRKAQQGATPTGPQQPTTDSGAKGGPGIWPWVVTGVGAATVGAGLFVGLQARSKRNDAQDNPVSRDAQNDFESAQSMASTANVLLIAGTVIAAGGVTWALLGQKKNEPATASSLHLTFTPSSVRIGGTL